MKWNESLIIQKEVIAELCKNEQLKKDVEKQIEISTNTKGFHYFTGIGKNGFVAAKVASTFNSLGIRSLFIDPVNTLHGDMNIFEPQDLVFTISKSGETEELLTFVRALRNMNFDNIISVVSNQNSSLAKIAKHVIVIPINVEGDHLNMAPVASSIAYIAVLQAIAVELSSKKDFTKNDFVKGHPGGTLGKTKV